ncbi:MAG: sensor histidine kinase [Bacteroidota bacterium]
MKNNKTKFPGKNFAQQLLLNEKDWLVREIHHRVKNNFHMVVGLMGTQSAYIKSSEALQALEDSKHRIHTMSLIHQKLYQSENLSATMMPDYIHELVSYLKDSFETQHILFVIHCERIELELSYSLPLGLILNEAITNSIKYAFPDKHEGTLQITLHHTAADEIQLMIADNGIGVTITEGDTMKSTMGLNLMKGLTEDISGAFSIKNQGGTIIQIDFRYEVVKHTDIKLEDQTGTMKGEKYFTVGMRGIKQFPEFFMRCEQGNLRPCLLAVVAMCFTGMRAAAQYPVDDQFRHSVFKTELSANAAVAELPILKMTPAKSHVLTSWPNII